MIKNGFCFLIFSFLLNSFSSALAITLTIPTTSGTITRNITPFDRSGQTAVQVYNYNPINARYEGDIAIDPGTNMFFVNTLDGLTLFMVNQAYPDLIGQLKYQVTTKGDLLFRDDQPDVDNDPIQIITNPDSTKTFISTEGFSDQSCQNGVCQTDGLVIGLTDSDPIISWGYDTSFELINIDFINFWSSNPSENLSVSIGTGLGDFDPDNGEVGVGTNIPESSPRWGFLGVVIAALVLRKIKLL